MFFIKIIKIFYTTRFIILLLYFISKADILSQAYLRSHPENNLQGKPCLFLNQTTSEVRRQCVNKSPSHQWCNDILINFIQTLSDVARLSMTDGRPLKVAAIHKAIPRNVQSLFKVKLPYFAIPRFH